MVGRVRRNAQREGPDPSTRPDKSGRLRVTTYGTSFWAKRGMTCRYNTRRNDYVFRDTLMAPVEAEAVPYQELIREKMSDSTLYRRQRRARQE